jgi:hypothetical protein
MMTNTMTAAVAQSIIVELAVEDRLATCRSLPRVAAAISTLGEAATDALYRKEIKAWASRRARWAKSVMAV